MLFKQFKSVNYETDAVKKLMPELASNKESNEAKLHIIYDYIQKNYIIKDNQADNDFIPQAPDKLIEQHFGSSRELTALFIAHGKKCWH